MQAPYQGSKKQANKIKARTPNPSGVNRRRKEGPKVQIGVRLHRPLVEKMDKTPYNRTQLIEAALQIFLDTKEENLKIEPLLLTQALWTAEPALVNLATLETVTKALNLLNR